VAQHGRAEAGRIDALAQCNCHQYSMRAIAAAYMHMHSDTGDRFGVLTGVCLHCCLWQLCMTPKGNRTYPTCMM
jgi:hypothetical protein